MLVEAAQHMIGRRPHFWVVATQSHHCHSHSVAGYKLQAVDHALWYRNKKMLNLPKTELIWNDESKISIILTWSQYGTEEGQKKAGIVQIPKILYGTVNVEELLIFLYLIYN